MLKLIFTKAIPSLGKMARNPAESPLGAALRQLLVGTVTYGLMMFGYKYIIKDILSDFGTSKEAKQRAKDARRHLHDRLGRYIETDQYEDAIASEVANPNSIDVTLEDIGGLEETKNVLHSKVILPIQHPEMFNTYLLRQAKGVLLYGPPGTGKTMLAKALAKQSGCTFINVNPSTLMSKWYGETQKLTQAIFTLAQKAQPCIIFIDEVDSLLAKRRATDHEATSLMRTEFMQLWDGFSTDSQANVMILAATNRPWELDEAVLRRFGVKLEVGMPDAKQREAILRLILNRQVEESVCSPGSVSVDEKLAKNIAEPGGRAPQAKLAEQAEGLSGSDLFQLCSRAAALAAGEHLQEQGGQNGHASANAEPKAIELRHFTQVLKSFKASTHEAYEYLARMQPHAQ